MRISRQLKHAAYSSDDVHNLYFGVKFYAADPCKLIEEITRYQLYLQVKQDVLQGRLPVTFELASELGAFVVQCEWWWFAVPYLMMMILICPRDNTPLLLTCISLLYLCLFLLSL